MSDAPHVPSTKALLRYEAIAQYLAAKPKRGQRGPLLQQLAAQTWMNAQGEQLTCSAETLRTWVRRYRRGGVAALEDKPREQRGVGVLSAELVEKLCSLKREVPARSLDRIITIAEEMELAPVGTLRRSTLHRVLREAGLSGRPKASVSDTDLDRFEALAPNDLWQSDMLVGPWLEDPEGHGRMRRACLYLFVDDHSRQLLHGRFSFKGDLAALEVVFRRCLQKYGVCRRVYYDNALVYRSAHMKHIAATLGLHGIVFTKRYRPMGHGKVEALNRLIRSAFIAELAVTKIQTLDELNEAFSAWAECQYNRRVHSETGQTPTQRWQTGAEKIRYADERLLCRAFSWREHRTPDKTGLFSLFGKRYQIDSTLGRRRVEVHYDPEDLSHVDVWHQGRFVERARLFEVGQHRRPTPKQHSPMSAAGDAKRPPLEPAANWLGHLVAKRRKEGFVEPSPRQHVIDAARRRKDQDQRVVDAIRSAVDPAVFDEAAIREYLERFGPFDAHQASLAMQRVLDGGHADHHVTVYLDAIRQDATTQGAHP